ncbi:MAG: hypothetical protein ACR2PA_19810 [Hyphomicrobiaceae bacterium]
MCNNRHADLPADLDLSRLKSALAGIRHTIDRIPKLHKVAAGLAIAVKELENAEIKASQRWTASYTTGRPNGTRH